MSKAKKSPAQILEELFEEKEDLKKASPKEEESSSLQVVQDKEEEPSAVDEGKEEEPSAVDEGKEEEPSAVEEGKEEEPSAVDEKKSTVNLTAQLNKGLNHQEKQFQIASQVGLKRDSPLQMQLFQSKNLSLAQERVASLEEEIQELREDNEALVSAGDVLTEKVSQISIKNEDISRDILEQKEQFRSEKKILTVALRDSHKEKLKLEATIKELKNRLSKDLQNIRGRENTLEHRIEIIKMESSVLQAEKDKKILELQKKIHKVDNNIKQAHQKCRELEDKVKNLQESSSKTTAVLRATIHNLEGKHTDDLTSTSFSEEDKE